ncbi:MAG: helix-turn-helix protein AraC type [Mucilaginibacter sp.]|nr:helix-turn-helix protein AraC type [Mucilaginibacter sp.]
MKIEKYLPAEIFKSYIKCFMIIESKQAMVNRVLPDTSMVMVFRFKGKVANGNNDRSFPLSVMSGIQQSGRSLAYAEDSATLLVMFTEGGAAAFFKEPLQELFNLSISLDQLISPTFVRELEEQLAEAKSNQSRVTMVERFLLYLSRRSKPDQMVIYALQQMKQAKGNLKIKDLLTVLPISRNPFEKRFRHIVGTSPKRFSGIIRLKTLISQYSTPGSLADAAYQAGYFDQAHFIRDFKAFTGQTPQSFFKSPTFW